MNIPLAPSGLRQSDIQVAIDALNSGNLTMGKQVRDFEIEMAEYLGTKYFVMVNSGSSANLAMIETLMRPSTDEPRLRVGDGVLVPAIAWPTTIWPLMQLGLLPIFVDVLPNSLAIDLEKSQEIIQNNISGRAGEGPIRCIFPIHPLGRAISSSELKRFSEKNNLVLINDVCESLGSWENESHAGTSGLMASFSFYFSHHITTMEGGGIATNDEMVNNDLRSIRSHGWSRDRNDKSDWNSEIHPSLKKFNFVSSGFNIRPMEIQAAIGRVQLKSLDEFVAKRRENVNKVKNAISGTKLSIIGVDENVGILEDLSHSWMHIPLKITSSNAKEIRSYIVKTLENHGIETRPPLTGNFLRQPAARKFFPNLHDERGFPIADSISDSTFLVGCHHDLNKDQVRYLCDNLNIVASNISKLE